MRNAVIHSPPFFYNFYGFYTCLLSDLQEEMGTTVGLHEVPPHAVERTLIYFLSTIYTFTVTEHATTLERIMDLRLDTI